MFFVAETLQKRARIPSGSSAQTRQRGYYPREKISGAVKTVPCRNQRTTICEILPIALLVLIRLLSFAKIPKIFRAKIYCIAIPPVNFPEAPPPRVSGAIRRKHPVENCQPNGRTIWRAQKRASEPSIASIRTVHRVHPNRSSRPSEPSIASIRRLLVNCFAPAEPLGLREFKIL